MGKKIDVAKNTAFNSALIVFSVSFLVLMGSIVATVVVPCSSAATIVCIASAVTFAVSLGILCIGEKINSCSKENRNLLSQFQDLNNDSNELRSITGGYRRSRTTETSFTYRPLVS